MAEAISLLVHAAKGLLESLSDQWNVWDKQVRVSLAPSGGEGQLVKSPARHPYGSVNFNRASIFTNAEIQPGTLLSVIRQ